MIAKDEEVIGRFHGTQYTGRMGETAIVMNGKHYASPFPDPVAVVVG